MSSITVKQGHGFHVIEIDDKFIEDINFEADLFSKGLPWSITAVSEDLQPFRDWFISRSTYNELHELALAIVQHEDKDGVERFLDFFEVNPPDLSEDQSGGYEGVKELMLEHWFGNGEFYVATNEEEATRASHGNWFTEI